MGINSKNFYAQKIEEYGTTEPDTEENCNEEEEEEDQFSTS